MLLHNRNVVVLDVNVSNANVEAENVLDDLVNFAVGIVRVQVVQQVRESGSKVRPLVARILLLGNFETGDCRSDVER